MAGNFQSCSVKISLTLVLGSRRCTRTNTESEVAVVAGVGDELEDDILVAQGPSEFQAKILAEGLAV